MAPTVAKKAEPAKTSPPKLSDVADLIDESTFEQILEMDDDDERDFSKGIVYGFFDQAKGTFENIEAALDRRDLKDLSQLGHFLKGSSATLGLNHVRDGCEKIQHFGNGLDENGSGKLSKETCLANIAKTLKDVKVEYAKVEKFLCRYYGEELTEEEEEPVEKEETKKEPADEAKADVKEEEKPKAEPKK
ncbi:Multistep phosphorelay regulator 1 [Penicillium macrosclerotiorum]|uniref:Multistep phosphorelay regulator 1 n=1 Tax=Penicillium macrosclerotiorum TaxID=303699 RepID=UPI0025480F7D|nr:Multistep phosphorelay regulator 1 [Penicillium macrosclerotiorum]KAJ5669412.1 Multistep phosphorelay regulator 1 [Penicillium macrosclerotiorum]